MQRKQTKKTRGTNADDKKFQGCVIKLTCVIGSNYGPIIVDYCRDATFKHNKVLIGKWFCVPQCVECDKKKTFHGKRQGNEDQRWFLVAAKYGEKKIPIGVFITINDRDKWVITKIPYHTRLV